MCSVAHNLQTSPFLLVIWMWTFSTQVVLMHYTGRPVIRRSTEVNWGQWPLPTFSSFTAFYGYLRRWFRFRHSFCTKKTWNEVTEPRGHQRSMTSYVPKMIFRFCTSKNHPRAFKNHRNVFYSSQGTRWTLKFCSNSIRSKVIGDHGFSSLFGTWPDLRGHWLT